MMTHSQIELMMSTSRAAHTLNACTVCRLEETPECTLDDGAGRCVVRTQYMSLRSPPISLVYRTAKFIGVDVCCLAALQK